MKHHPLTLAIWIALTWATPDTTQLIETISP